MDRAFNGKHKPSKVASIGKTKLPWLWRFPEAWARNLTVRSILGSFQIFVGKAGKRKIRVMG